MADESKSNLSILVGLGIAMNLPVPDPSQSSFRKSKLQQNWTNSIVECVNSPAYQTPGTLIKSTKKRNLFVRCTFGSSNESGEKTKANKTASVFDWPRIVRYSVCRSCSDIKILTAL